MSSPVIKWSLPLVFSTGVEVPPQPISNKPFHQWRFPDGTVCADFFRSGSGYLLKFPELAEFYVSGGGASVIAYPVLDTSVSTIEHLYLNQVLPLALSHQGKLVFHASAVEIADGAIAFMGVSGRGKSTLAASFAGSGFRFLTDDGLLLEKSVDCYLAQPSHPSIRLWDDSRLALVHAAATLAPPVQYTPKARILSNEMLPFCNEARRLRRVYFLGDGNASEVSIKRMKQSEALIELVNHSFLLDIDARDVIASHFDELTQLVEMPIYHRVDYPRRYEDLPRVREAIIRHANEEESKVT